MALSPQVCANLLWQPLETNPGSQTKQSETGECPWPFIPGWDPFSAHLLFCTLINSLVLELLPLHHVLFPHALDQVRFPFFTAFPAMGCSVHRGGSAPGPLESGMWLGLLVQRQPVRKLRACFLQVPYPSTALTPPGATLSSGDPPLLRWPWDCLF